MIVRLRTILFFTGWVLGTLVMGFAGLPVLLLSQRCVWWFNGLWARFTLGWVRLACGLRSEVRGVPQAPLIASKHQSAWDTMVLWRLLHNPVFVLKRELYWIPIFGWYLWRSGQIAINRSEGRSAYEQIERQAPKLLAQGRSIVMFPEGTRVRIGQYRAYRTGVARVSALLGLDVAPAALNAGLFWPKHSLLKRPGTAVLEFLAPMPRCAGETGEWMADLEQRIEQRTQELVEEAR